MDPADEKSKRFGFRLHPDLMAEMVKLARLEGVKLSAFVEKALINWVNEKGGSEKLDAIGRYRKPPKKQ